MRLIGGVLRLDGGPAEAGTLRAMAAAMTPPGFAPASALSLDGPAGLFTLDFRNAASEPAVAPPTLPSHDGLTVAGDLRLDRPGDLAARLGMPPDATAAALAARCLRADEADFPDRLDGDVAVALWDGAARRLWLGRDFMGVRPLSWTCRPGRWFAFASLPAGLFKAGLAASAPSPFEIGALPTSTYLLRDWSGFADIRTLRPGHSLRIDVADGALADGEPRPHRAYRPDPAMVGSWRHGPAAAAEEMRRLVTAAVEARLPPAGTVGSHLSGGLDSSAITVLAARAMRGRGGRVHALSFTCEDLPDLPVSDERDRMNAVLAQEPDLDWSRIRGMKVFDPDLIDPSNPRAVSDHVLAAVCVAAARAGADRILSGVGGDEAASFLCGWLYRDLLLGGHVGHLARELPALARREGVPLDSVMRTRLLRPLAPAALMALLDRARGRGGERAAIAERRLSHLQPDVRREVTDGLWQLGLNGCSPAERLRILTDGHVSGRCTNMALVAARHGLAMTFPLLDRRVVDFAQSLPLTHLVADGLLRQPFREAMRGVLPEPVRIFASKHVALADVQVHLARAKASALAHLAAAEANPAVTSIFDTAAIRRDLETIPDEAEALRRARLHAVGDEAPGTQRWAQVVAILALGLAIHVDRTA